MLEMSDLLPFFFSLLLSLVTNIYNSPPYPEKK